MNNYFLEGSRKHVQELLFEVLSQLSFKSLGQLSSWVTPPFVTALHQLEIMKPLLTPLSPLMPRKMDV